MPTYKFKDNNTGRVWTELMRIHERDSFLAECPYVEQLVHGAPMVVTGVGTRPKIDDAFRDKLKEIKKKNPRNTIDSY